MEQSAKWSLKSSSVKVRESVKKLHFNNTIKNKFTNYCNWHKFKSAFLRPSKVFKVWYFFSCQHFLFSLCTVAETLLLLKQWHLELFIFHFFNPFLPSNISTNPSTWSRWLTSENALITNIEQFKINTMGLNQLCFTRSSSDNNEICTLKMTSH